MKRELDLVREQLRLAHERELFRNQFDSELYSSGLISAAALPYEDVSTASTQQSVVAHVHEPSQHLPQQSTGRENGSYTGRRVGRDMYARKNARMTVEGRCSEEFHLNPKSSGIENEVK